MRKESFASEYKNHDDIKTAMKKAGLVVRDVAHKLQMPPSTLYQKLNGYNPLRPEEREAVLQVIQEGKGA